MGITVSAIFIRISDTTYIVGLCDHVATILRFLNTGCKLQETYSLIGYCLHMQAYSVYLMFIFFVLCIL